MLFGNEKKYEEHLKNIAISGGKGWLHLQFVKAKRLAILGTAIVGTCYVLTHKDPASTSKNSTSTSSYDNNRNNKARRPFDVDPQAFSSSPSSEPGRPHTEYKSMSFADGSRYLGETVEGIPNGKGTMVFGQSSPARGNRYEGNFVNGQFSGKGTYWLNNGDRYEGNFVDGLRSEKGTYWFHNGDRYEGDFVEGQPSGKGTLWFNNSNRYEGDFVDGLPSGKGTYWFHNGDRYEGDMLNNAFYGRGVMTYENGRVEDGIWEKDVFKGPVPASTESVLSQSFSATEHPSSRDTAKAFFYKDPPKGNYVTLLGGSKYLGPYVTSEFGIVHPHGAGVLIYSDSSWFEGNFVNGIEIGKGVYWSGTGKWEGNYVKDSNGIGVLDGIARYTCWASGNVSYAQFDKGDIVKWLDSLPQPSPGY